MRLVLPALVAALAASPTLADPLVGSDRFLCAAVQASACALDSECVEASPDYWNVPGFIEIDLKAKTLSTPPSSTNPRSTPIRSVERADGLIVLQGLEAGRAFSFVISEETGAVSVAVARDGVTVGVQGTCMPHPAAPRR